MYFLNQEFSSSQQIFEFTQISQQVNLNHCLAVLLNEKGFTVSRLHHCMESKNYYLSIQSVYRYLTTEKPTSRFPPLDFVEIFGQVLGFSDTEQKLLVQLWHLCHCWRRHQKFSNSNE
jgi:hypothetical protein